MSTFFITHVSPDDVVRGVGSFMARLARRVCGAAKMKLSLRKSVVILAAGIAAGISTPVSGASSSKSKGESGPVLMSRTGGAWENVKELEQAAANANPKAQAQLGEMLLRGDRVAKNEARGVALLEKAARAGSSAAAFRIGMLLSDGASGVAKDPVRALQYFKAAAAGGEKEAFFNIGAAYGSAKGVKRDYGEALGWLIVARQRGADANAEQELRARIKAQASWIARGERRAKEIEQEFAGKKVADLLPPEASLAVPASTTPELRPNASSSQSKPAVDLKPSLPAKADESLKPTLPALPPPSIPRP